MFKLFSDSISCSGAQQVLDAACTLFAEHGVDAVSMQDIATKAKVSKANIFHHFENKERLYLEVIRAAVTAHATDVAAIISSPQPFEKRFTALMHARISELVNNERGTRLVMREISTGNLERAKNMATQIFSEKVSQNIAFFEDAKQRGELRGEIDPGLASMLLGACGMFYFNCRDVSRHMRELVGGPDMGEPQQFSELMCAALSQGLAKPLAAPAKRRAGIAKVSTRPLKILPAKTASRTRKPKS